MKVYPCNTKAEAETKESFTWAELVQNGKAGVYWDRDTSNPWYAIVCVSSGSDEPNAVFRFDGEEIDSYISLRDWYRLPNARVIFQIEEG